MKYLSTFLLLLATISTVDSRLLRWRKGRRHGGGGGRGGGGGGHGWGGGGGGGGGGGQKASNTAATSVSPQESFRRLFDHTDNIKRNVDYSYPGGVKTTTEAKDGDDTLNDWIMEHVTIMKALVDSGGSIRRWDGLFDELLNNRGDLNLECSQEGGSGGKVVCTHTGDDCYAEALAKAHAEAVSSFVEDPDARWEDHEDLIDDHMESPCNR